MQENFIKLLNQGFTSDEIIKAYTQKMGGQAFTLSDILLLLRLEKEIRNQKIIKIER